MKKRLISFLLCISMIIPGMMGYAAEEATADDAIYDFLIALNLMTNESDGEFHPDRVYTRGEFAKLITRAANISVQDTDAFETLFYDLTSEDPYYAEIKAAVAAKLMKSYETNYFRSEKTITYSQAAYSFAALAGYGDLMAFYSNPESVARRVGILDGISSVSTVTKGTLARMLYNTLHINQFIATGYGSDKTYKESDKTVLEYNHHMIYGTGIVNQIKNTTLTEPLDENDDIIVIGEQRLHGDLDSEYLGYYVKYYYTEENEIASLVYCAKDSEENRTLVIDAEDILSCSDRTITYQNGNSKKSVTLDYTADVIYNNTAYPSAEDSDFMPDVGYIELIDNGGDSSYEVAKIYSYTIAVVEYVNDDPITIYSKYSDEVFGGRETDVISVFNAGRKSALSRLSEDEVIAVMQPKCEDNRNITVDIISRAMAGTIDALRDDSITIGINRYEYAKRYVIDETVEAGEQVSVYLYMGKAVAVLHSTETGEKYGYLIAASGQSSVLSDHVDRILLKIYNNKGEIAVYNIAASVVLNGGSVKKGDDLLTGLNVSARMSSSYSDGYPYAQPILFKTNADGEVSSIATMANTDPLVFEKGAGGSFRYSNSTRSLYDSTDKSYAFSIASDSEVMYVPLSERDEAIYYNYRLGSNLSRLNTYKAEAFNLNENGEAEFVVIYSSENGGVADAAVPGILTGIEEVYDAETQSVKKQVTFVGNTSAEKSYIVSEDCTIPDLNIGDVVAFNTNYNGEILTLERRFDVTAIPDKASRMKITNSPGGNYLWFESESMVKYGTFYNIGKERLGHTTTLPNEDMTNKENYNNYYAASLVVYVYDSEARSGKVKVGQKTDIIPYQVDAANASVGVVVTNIGTVKYVYVVK